MSSLRLALKLSMAEAQPESDNGRNKGKKGSALSDVAEKSKFELEGPTLDEILSGKCE